MVTRLYPGLYCAVVSLFVIVQRIAVTSAVHERLFSHVVEHAEHYRVLACLVIVIEYRSALHAMTLNEDAGASETLIGGYICTISRRSTPPPPNIA